MSILDEEFVKQNVRDFDTLRNGGSWKINDTVSIPALKNAVLVMLVKNAEDIIGINLRHHYQLGFRRFFLLDNNSTDKTAEIILSFKRGYAEAEVFYSTDFLTGYFQQTKTEAMARFAEFYLRETENRPDWIFPIDSDEFITCCTDKGEQAIRDFTNYLMDPMVRILVFNWAHSALYSPEKHQFTHFRNSLSETELTVCRHLKPHVTKTAYRTGYNMSPDMGNHFVNAYEWGKESARTMTSIGFCMLHFPMRSLEQFRQKIEDGMQALKGTSYPKSTGEHWRFYYEEYKNKGDQALLYYLRDYIRKTY